MFFSRRNPFFRFLFILMIFIGFGLLLRFLYHAVPGGVVFISHSWFIDTFYRLLIGPVHFLRTLSGVAHRIGYAPAAAQYFIHLKDADVSLFLWIPCLGISLMYIYTSLVIAFQNPWRKKLAYILCGNLIIQLLNILRLYGLSLIITHTHATQTKFTSLPWLAVNHETIFNYGVILLIFLMFVVYARKSKRVTTRRRKRGDEL